jgi:two-component system, chemotaxis family, protein-glutamate methylesterase/glutaminase
MMENTLRALVVDDTVAYRSMVSSALAEIPNVEVVGVAANGKIALQKIESLRPDVLTLDIEMPEVDGLEVLRRLRESKTNVGAIVLSAFSAEGARVSIEALKLGAFDFVIKPTDGTFAQNYERLQSALQQRLTAFARQRQISRILCPVRGADDNQTLLRGGVNVPVPNAAAPAPPPHRMYRASKRGADDRVVAIGVSTGGPVALTEMLPKLPADFPLPVVVVQHMPPIFTKSLADDLNSRCQLRVREASHGDRVVAGSILIAPGGKQMRLACGENGVEVAITDDPPENSCRPSVDYLFRSVVDLYGDGAIGVIMTGMGNDGVAGCRKIKAANGIVLAQDQSSCVVFGMPREPIEQGIAEFVGPPSSLAAEVTRLAKERALACK